MIGKLVKTESTYHLVVNNKIIASVGDSDGKLQKLSLKNCEIVRSGYDLDELAENYGIENGLDLGCFDEVKNSKTDFKAGFQKALEIIDGKKFSKEDMQICRLQTELQLLNKYYERIGLDADTEIEETLEQLKSIQKNEWEVEVETENSLTNGYKNQPENIIGFISEYKSVPKLDENGCLILKRK